VAIKPVAIHEFLQKAGNIYEAIVIASKRARQIHDEQKIELSQRLETLKALNATPEPEEDVETVTLNPDQLKISLEFEKRPKATEMAIDEILEKRVTYRYKEKVELFAKKEETPTAEE
jgi:DNA-directed RNA polymerase subunit K/omega